MVEYIATIHDIAGMFLLLYASFLFCSMVENVGTDIVAEPESGYETRDRGELEQNEFTGENKHVCTDYSLLACCVGSLPCILCDANQAKYTRSVLKI